MAGLQQQLDRISGQKDQVKGFTGLHAACRVNATDGLDLRRRKPLARRGMCQFGQQRARCHRRDCP
jgi:hypothetical protein